MKQAKFSFGKVISSFGFAFNGLKILFQEEHNSWVHLIASVSVVMAGFYFKITDIEWIAIVFAIGFVITMEVLNTAIENIADFISPEKHEMIKRIKDLSAAAVLVSALVAMVIGLIVFIPRIL